MAKIRHYATQAGQTVFWIPRGSAVTGATVNGGAATVASSTQLTATLSSGVNIGDAVEITYTEWPQVQSGPVTIARNFTQITAPADTNENTLVSCVIPGGSLGPNGLLRVFITATTTNNANAKNPRIKFGGTTFRAPNLASTAAWQDWVWIRNRNDEKVQFSHASGGAGQIGTTGSATPVTATVDTTVDQPLLITMQKAVGTDVITLESYLIEVVRV